MRSQKRLKLQFVDGKFRMQTSHFQSHGTSSEPFRIVIREKGRMEVPIRILSRKGN